MTYNPLLIVDLWKDIPFTRLSPTAKRIMVAWWTNRGKQFGDITTLNDRERFRATKIRGEEGLDTLQDIMLAVEELTEENRKLRSKLNSRRG